MTRTKSAPAASRSARTKTAPAASQAVSAPTANPLLDVMTSEQLDRFVEYIRTHGIGTTATGIPILNATPTAPTATPTAAKPRKSRKVATAPTATPTAPTAAKAAKAANGLSFANALASVATRFATDIVRATMRAGVSFDSTGWIVEADKSATDAIELVFVGEHAARAAKFAHTWMRAQRDLRQITTPYKGTSGELRISAQLTRTSVAL